MDRETALLHLEELTNNKSLNETRKAYRIAEFKLTQALTLGLDVQECKAELDVAHTALKAKQLRDWFNGEQSTVEFFLAQMIEELPFAMDNRHSHDNEFYVKNPGKLVEHERRFHFTDVTTVESNVIHGQDEIEYHVRAKLPKCYEEWLSFLDEYKYLDDWNSQRIIATAKSRLSEAKSKYFAHVLRRNDDND